MPQPRNAAARERRAESDEVRRNIPAEIVSIFERVKRTSAARHTKSRTETFLQRVEENPAEVYAVRSAEAAQEGVLF